MYKAASDVIMYKGNATLLNKSGHFFLKDFICRHPHRGKVVRIDEAGSSASADPSLSFCIQCYEESDILSILAMHIARFSQIYDEDCRDEITLNLTEKHQSGHI